jgi:hypothetical protein
MFYKKTHIKACFINEMYCVRTGGIAYEQLNRILKNMNNGIRMTVYVD